MTELEQLLSFVELYKDFDSEKAAELFEFSAKIKKDDFIFGIDSMKSFLKWIYMSKSKILKSKVAKDLF